MINMDVRLRETIKVCKLYYEKGLNQSQIAEDMAISKMQVSRILKKAKEDHIVKFLVIKSGVYVELEEEIKRKYKLKKVTVIESDRDEDAKKDVAEYAAYYIDKHLEQDSVIAVGWGTTMQLIAENMYGNNNKKTFVPIIGGHMASDLSFHSSTIAAKMAAKSNGETFPLIVPAFADEPRIKEMLVQNEDVSKVLKIASSADCAVFSLGNPLLPGNSLDISGYLKEHDIKRLKEERVICDIASVVFLDESGRECCKDLFNRCVGITPEQLKEIPRKVCVLAGTFKKVSVIAAMKKGYIDELIIDKDLAEEII